MQAIISQNKDVIRFILIFILSYVILSILYSYYLSVFSSVDGYTNTLANQTVGVLNLFGYETYPELIESEKRIKLITHGRFVAFIMEGCNAISIMILFLSFVLAFSKSINKHLWYIIFGLVFIYVINILRIVLLTILVYHKPEWTHILHSVVFPGMIYGAVFLLWLYWVKFLKQNNVNE